MSKLVFMSPEHVARMNELLAADPVEEPAGDWVELMRNWADRELRRGTPRLLDIATPRFETAMIEVALAHTRGRRGEAAEVLGWGRNTLTRKLKELQLEHVPDAGD